MYFYEIMKFQIFIQNKDQSVIILDFSNLKFSFWFVMLWLYVHKIINRKKNQRNSTENNAGNSM